MSEETSLVRQDKRYPFVEADRLPVPVKDTINHAIVSGQEWIRVTDKENKKLLWDLAREFPDRRIIVGGARVEIAATQEQGFWAALLHGKGTISLQVIRETQPAVLD